MAEAEDEGLAPATRLVTAGRRGEWTGTPGSPGVVVNPPVWRASTHLFGSAAEYRQGFPNADGNFDYGRRGGPTQWALAEALTAIEPGAAGTMLYPSGVAALAGALLTVLRPGDILLMSDHAYEPSRNIGRGLLKEFGIETRWFDPLDPAGFAAKIDEHCKAVLLESPGSLSIEVADVPALAAIAKARGLAVILDNTWAGPLGFPALTRGADIAVMSLTKHACGHADVLMGSASAREEFYAKLRRTAQQLGHVVSPDDAALMLRGLRTMGIRLAQASASALTLAQWLEGRAEIARVLCPMLPGSPGHELWKRDFTGGCGLFSIVFKGKDSAARDAFVDGLSLFGIGSSFGGFESLATPVDPGRSRRPEAWPPAGTDSADRFAARISIGLEDPADLKADLERGLAAWAAA